ncbi:hypothetical protein HDU97_003725 [Phlyctochytrium planicorne]|nr:hypothetical protein HDU97_003725 [Phlyctochytrium planicorne]
MAPSLNIPTQHHHRLVRREQDHSFTIGLFTYLGIGVIAAVAIIVWWRKRKTINQAKYNEMTNEFQQAVMSGTHLVVNDSDPNTKIETITPKSDKSLLERFQSLENAQNVTGRALVVDQNGNGETLAAAESTSPTFNAEPVPPPPFASQQDPSSPVYAAHQKVEASTTHTFFGQQQGTLSSNLAAGYVPQQQQQQQQQQPASPKSPIYTPPPRAASASPMHAAHQRAAAASAASAGPVYASQGAPTYQQPSYAQGQGTAYGNGPVYISPYGGAPIQASNGVASQPAYGYAYGQRN